MYPSEIEAVIYASQPLSGVRLFESLVRIWAKR